MTHIKNFAVANLGAPPESVSENLILKNALRYFDFCVAHSNVFLSFIIGVAHTFLSTNICRVVAKIADQQCLSV